MISFRKLKNYIFKIIYFHDYQINYKTYLSMNEKHNDKFETFTFNDFVWAFDYVLWEEKCDYYPNIFIDKSMKSYLGHEIYKILGVGVDMDYITYRKVVKFLKHENEKR